MEKNWKERNEKQKKENRHHRYLIIDIDGNKKYTRFYKSHGDALEAAERLAKKHNFGEEYEKISNFSNLY